MIFAVAAAVFLLDRIIKILAINFLSGPGSIKILPGIFHLTLVFNDGTAFGLFKGQNRFFIFIAVFIICAIVFYIQKTKPEDVVIRR